MLGIVTLVLMGASILGIVGAKVIKENVNLNTAGGWTKLAVVLFCLAVLLVRMAAWVCVFLCIFKAI